MRMKRHNPYSLHISTICLTTCSTELHYFITTLITTVNQSQAATQIIYLHPEPRLNSLALVTKSNFSNHSNQARPDPPSPFPPYPLPCPLQLAGANEVVNMNYLNSQTLHLIVVACFRFLLYSTFPPPSQTTYLLRICFRPA